MFGAPGSAACATAAKAQGKTPTPGVHCLLSGPDDNRQDLLSGLPSGVTASEGEQLVVPPGTVVLQAADPNASKQTNSERSRTHSSTCSRTTSSLFGNEITNPQQSTDQGGSPDVTFSFNSKGGKRVPERHVDDRASRRSGQRSRSAAQPALRGRARQQADHGPADRLQDVSGRDPGRQRRRHHRRLHDPVRPGPRDPAAARRAADQPQADLRVAGVGDARQAGAAPGPDRRLVGLLIVIDLPDRLLPRARRDRDRRPDRLRDLLLRADQADPDHADAAGHRRPDPDDRRRRGREHRHLRTRQGGDPRRALDPAGRSSPATRRA